METIKIINNKNEEIRVLTSEEKKRIKSYRFHPSVEKVIVDDWSKRKTPVVTKTKNKISLVEIVTKIISILLPIILWVLYLDPQNSMLTNLFGENGYHYADKLMNVGLFLVWITIGLSPILFILSLVMLYGTKKKPWDPGLLGIWTPKNGIIAKFFIMVNVATVVGLLLNGWYVTTILLLFGYLQIYGGLYLVKSAVAKNIEKVLHPEEA
jgi:hypothetical protein